MSQSAYYTQTEVCVRLGVKRWSLWKFIKDGRLHPHKSTRDRRRNLYRCDEVDTLADARVPLPIPIEVMSL